MFKKKKSEVRDKMGLLVENPLNLTSFLKSVKHFAFVLFVSVWAVTIFFFNLMNNFPFHLHSA